MKYNYQLLRRPYELLTFLQSRVIKRSLKSCPRLRHFLSPSLVTRKNAREEQSPRVGKRRLLAVSRSSARRIFFGSRFAGWGLLVDDYKSVSCPFECHFPRKGRSAPKFGTFPHQYPFLFFMKIPRKINYLALFKVKVIPQK